MNKMYNSKILFSLPDFFIHKDLNLFLSYLWKEETYKFYDDIIIDNIFGSFPCIWNGGRPVRGSVSGLCIQDIINKFNNLGISLRFTFTNLLIEEKHLNDTIGNKILEYGNYSTIKNSVNVTSEKMMTYVETNYNNYYCIWSTTLGLKDLNKINALTETHMLVLDYSFNNDFEFLSKLKHPENIEILANESCIEDCPFRQEHYKAISAWQMGEPIAMDSFSCKFPNKKKIYQEYRSDRNNRFISYKDIKEKYLPLGFNKFKLEGRGEDPILLIEKYINYLIKPEYSNEIRNRLLMYSRDTTQGRVKGIYSGSSAELRMPDFSSYCL